ncbi:unnamed protein product [Blepharisma stoltei]|uniref:Uncharacterized protein n=1 Tax=Blepharisma stoltei TaxID=1481888 RepID=A0AAU9J7H7_9CILI|nr:unnamed protein product [Blepharisma stoltei]
MGKNRGKGRWTLAEHQRYKEAYKSCKTWKEISTKVGTRTPEQCLSHHQKMRLKRSKESPQQKDASTQYDIDTNSASELCSTLEECRFLMPSASTDIPVDPSIFDSDSILNEP